MFEYRVTILLKEIIEYSMNWKFTWNIFYSWELHLGSLVTSVQYFIYMSCISYWLIMLFSVHATGTENQELKDLQEMLRSGDLSQSEKQ